MFKESNESQIIKENIVFVIEQTRTPRRLMQTIQRSQKKILDLKNKY